jgi:hypothetical protein
VASFGTPTFSAPWLQVTVAPWSGWSPLTLVVEWKWHAQLDTEIHKDPNWTNIRLYLQNPGDQEVLINPPVQTLLGMLKCRAALGQGRSANSNWDMWWWSWRLQ